MCWWGSWSPSALAAASPPEAPSCQAQGIGVLGLCPSRLPPPSPHARVPRPLPSLLDNRVHGCDALSYNEGLAVGHVIQGRARVARQDDLQQEPRLLGAFATAWHPASLARLPAWGCRLRGTTPGNLSCLAVAPCQLWGQEDDPNSAPRRPPHLPATEAHGAANPTESGGAQAGGPLWPLALTSVPLERSSLTKGKTPKMTSTPLLSAKIKAHL